MNSFCIILLLLLIHLPLAACKNKSSSSKSQDTPPVTTTMGTKAYPSLAEVPACNSELNSHIVYVLDIKEFRLCTNSTWTKLELKGEKGDKGETGKDTSAVMFNQALQLHDKYRRSIFRVMLTCKKDADDAACTATPDLTYRYQGSAFLCGKNTACTNNHVVTCGSCLKVEKLELQQISSNFDSVRPETEAIPPFYSSSNPEIAKHGQKDLAKLTIGNLDAQPLPIATTDFYRSVTALKPVLSMSFPLSLEDLYTDIGIVNTPYIGDCRNQPFDSQDVSCAAAHYDFSTTNDTDHGSSGSPIIDLESGQVIGVVTGGTEQRNANYTWSIDASKLNDIAK